MAGDEVEDEGDDNAYDIKSMIQEMGMNTCKVCITKGVASGHWESIS